MIRLAPRHYLFNVLRSVYIYFHSASDYEHVFGIREPIDGLDNDGNEKPDDRYGWDFVDDDNRGPLRQDLLAKSLRAYAQLGAQRRVQEVIESRFGVTIMEKSRLSRLPRAPQKGGSRARDGVGNPR